MALSLDDRLLGEKVHNYCSSSSGSDDEGDSGDEAGDEREHKVQQQQPQQQLEEPREWRGAATNTGPKGVIDDEFLVQYRRQRIEEMRQSLAQRKLFGRVVHLDRGSFVQAVDAESPDVKVLVHIYDSIEEPACAAVNAALDELAGRYLTVKFCRLQASQALVSRRFIERGLPALVVYKAGEVTSSFVALGRELGDQCSANQLESFLTEFGVLSEALLADGQAVRLARGAGHAGLAESDAVATNGGRKIRDAATDGRSSDSDSD
uniref:Phosducin domain-containing protein n=1 Tax=Macrostomum lignano TaxID=282301 RepID=A0A1I8J2J8_9PLAT